MAKDSSSLHHKLTLPEIIIVSVVLISVFVSKMITIPIHTDESYWISSSSYFEEWISLDTEAESWQVNYMTLSGPALPKYLIAVGRLGGGFHADDLNKTYNYSLSEEENFLDGRIPSPKLLYVSRVPMTVQAILIGLFVYILLLQAQSRFFAISWLVFYSCNSLIQESLVRAMSEAPLLFFSIVSVICVLFWQNKLWSYLHAADQKNRNSRGFYFVIILAGAFLGLAAASKIHAFLLVIPFSFLLRYIFFQPGLEITRKESRIHFARTFLLFGLSSFLVFILMNPFLYLNPITGTALMFYYRIHEMGTQSQMYSSLSVIPIHQRWVKIFYALMTDFASIHGTAGLYINAALFITGFYQTVRDFIHTLKYRKPLDLTLLILFFFSLFVFAAFMSPLDWGRYFLFPAYVLTLINTKGVIFLVESGIRLVKKQNQRATND